MAIPWAQLVKWAPSIVQVSRELLKQTQPAASAPPPAGHELSSRVHALEQNERQQAELVAQMADQMAQMSSLLLSLRARVQWLTIGLVISLVTSAIALGLAIRWG
jgi:hypothetical protein